jgi:leucyl/phenylalanyl-tRNA--protein transferase
MGGNLQPQTLIDAYADGIFPCSDSSEPIFWWCPDPRAVLFCSDLHIPRSLRQQLRKRQYHVTMDLDFNSVIRHCANRSQTWIRPALQKSFQILHQEGYAHSVEVWDHGELVGGLYGMSMGRYFSGESMFSLRPNTAKIALVYLAQQFKIWDFPIIDCQQPSPHVQMLGARLITRSSFLRQLVDIRALPTPPSPWVLDSIDPMES